MSQGKGDRSVGRRRFLQMMAIGTAAGILPVACGTSGGGGGGGQTNATGAGTAPAPGTGGLKKIPRNRTLVLGLTGGQLTDFNEFNPYLTGTSTSTGFPYAFEGTYYYNSYHTAKVSGPPGMKSDQGLIPWLAETYNYNNDFTQLTIKLRNGVTWSDGQPLTSKDLVYTINMLKSNAPKLSWSVDMQTWVKDVTAVDDHTARITLSTANPRFMFDYFMYHQDIGIQIVPEHVWSGQDPQTFLNFDIGKGWPVTTGPWKLVLSTANERIFDRRDDWWAAKTGFHPLPEVQRILVIPGTDETKMVQFAISNTTEETIDLRPTNIKAVLAQNKAITTWSGEKVPYGYRDWWPVSLGFNDSVAPFNDAEIRWAVNHTIDRKQLVDIGYQGAGEGTLLPFPNFPALQPYLDAVKDQTKQIESFDLKKTAQIMQGKGYTKNSAGFWSKEGKTFSIVVQTLILFQDITPVLVEQLRKGGFDASFQLNEVYTPFQQKVFTGTADAFVLGHGGSVRDPYATLKLYHSRYSAPTGQQAIQPYHWVNKEFDNIVDEMATVSPTDAKLKDLFVQAMNLWIPALPDVGLVQWFHRIPTDTTYWTNWPSESNPYINSCYWHRTSPLWINTIKPTQK